MDEKLLEAFARALSLGRHNHASAHSTGLYKKHVPKALADLHEAGFVVVPVEIMKFLYGEGPLENLWFGDSHPAIKGHLWWRHVIQHRLAAAGGGGE